MTRPSITLLASLSLGLGAAALHAQAPAPKPQSPPAAAATPDEGFTQLGAHEHGRIVVNLAVEGGTLTAELDAPAINVVGFERAPRNATERKFVAEVDRWLGSGVGILGVPAAAGCQRSRVEYTPPKLGGDAQRHAHDHGHDHDHDHGHEDGSTHADYEARYTFACANPAALAWVDLTLLRRLRGVSRVEVNLVTPQKQTQLSVTQAAPRVALK